MKNGVHDSGSGWDFRLNTTLDLASEEKYSGRSLQMDALVMTLTTMDGKLNRIWRELLAFAFAMRASMHSYLT